MSNDDKWSAFINDDWDKPVVKSQLQLTSGESALRQKELPVKFEVKQSTTGSNSMSSYFNNSNLAKPKMQLLKKHEIIKTDNISDNNSSSDNSKNVEIAREEKLAKYEEVKRRIFGERG